MSESLDGSVCLHACAVIFSCFTDFLATRTNKIQVEYHTELIYRICSFNLAQVLHKLSWTYMAPKLTKKQTNYLLSGCYRESIAPYHEQFHTFVYYVRANCAYVIYEGVKLFMITLLFFRHYIQNICILRNRLISIITVNLKHGWASLWYYNHHSRGAVGVMWLFHFVSLGVRLQSHKSSIFWTYRATMTV